MTILRTIKSIALFTCWALLSSEALAARPINIDVEREAPRMNSAAQGAVAARMPKDVSVECLAAMAAGEAGGGSEKAQRNTMKTVINRLRLGYGSGICGLVYAQSQFAPCPNTDTRVVNHQRKCRVTNRIRRLAAQVIKEGLASSASAATHFHSYKNKFDHRASWSRKFTYLGFDGLHHLFVRRGVVNARLAAANQKRFGGGQGTETAPASIMAQDADRNRSGLWTSTAI